MEATIRRFCISPGAIASSFLLKRGMASRPFEVSDTPAPTESSPFAMSATEWLEIQLYVEKGLALPDTTYKLAHRLNMPPSTNFRAYNDLLALNHEINTHVSEWKNNVFPESVSMAKDVYDYSLKARAYYEPILCWANILSENPKKEDIKKQLVEHLKMLSQTIRVYQARSGNVAAKIKAFADQTFMDQISLSGADGKGGLMKVYNNRYKDAAGIVNRIKRDIEHDHQLINNLNSEYNYYMAEIAKTAYYIWIWPSGTIAAAIIRDKYGKKANEALNRINQAEMQIRSLSGDLSHQTQTIYILDHILTEISGISTPLSRALNIIQSIEGSWKAIADDFEALTELIVCNIAKALPCIMHLGVEVAIKEWEAVGKSANGYRQHAYIQINQESI